MSDTRQNLARKWRSKNFDQIIGQDISVRMIKNSLYLNHFFPVYLFSGQRGCGKTTTARVFAAAINCQYLHDFQLAPKEQAIPCMTCESCKALASGKHPDFIEMDAASHTGVDNVRQIIEAASLMPLLGRKKVYLIDEAHMLSKAAFNAFLKILEEPPETVIFILATTDEHKIIDTVRSRCFQLIFNAIDTECLVEHLVKVCVKEEITYETDGLRLLIREADGSARDALNLLEQVRFAAPTVTVKTVLSVLGYMSDDQLNGLIEQLLTPSDSPQALLSYVESIQLQQYAPDIIWSRIGIQLRTAVWHRYGCTDKNATLSDHVVQCVAALSVDTVAQLFSFYCQQELMFTRAGNKQLFLSMFLVRMWHTIHSGARTHEQGSGKQAPMPQPATIPTKATQPKQAGPTTTAQRTASSADPGYQAPWEKFLARIREKNDQLLLSLFSQSTIKNRDDESITVCFDKKFQFFADTLDETRSLWEPWLHEAYGKPLILKPLFEGESQSSSASVAQTNKSSSGAPRVPDRTSTRQQPTQSRSAVDVSDKEVWKTANAVMEHFPGRLTEIVEGK